MLIATLLSNQILQAKGMIDMHLADFSDADMMFRPAPAANHAIWQMGHLANATRGLVTACDPGVAFAFEDDARFGKSKAGFDDIAAFASKAELLGRFESAMQTAAAWVATLTEADLARPTPEPLKNFAPTVGSVAIALTSHATMHLGQFQVARRALGKPHVM